MTKQLPKYEQAKIKLSLSNSVLSAEVKFNQQTSQNQIQTQSFYFQTPSSADSVQPITLPSDYFV